jgi:hypothetical protein
MSRLRIWLGTFPYVYYYSLTRFCSQLLTVGESVALAR